MASDIRKIFEFTTYVEGFKKLERWAGQYFWKNYPPQKRYESDADHTWRMAVMLVLIEPHLSRSFDFKRAMKMTLIHDLPELLAGDMSPLGTDGTGNDSHAYNKDVANDKYEREKAAAENIFGKLPDAQRDDLLATWHEFESQASYESKVVKALDKIEGKLQALEYSKGVFFKEHFDFNMKYGNETYGADPATQELGDILMKTLQDNFQEFKKPV